MKAKNIVFIAKSLDNFIARKNGDLDWLEMIPNPEHLDMGYHALIKRIDALVMGKVTFLKVMSFGIPWPYEKHVFVLSNSLHDIPKNLESKVSILKGDEREVVNLIHQKGYYNLYIDGGKVIQNFLKQDLIDELIISTIPVLLGDGIPLFSQLTDSLEFKHESTQVYLGEVVQSSYIRKR